MAFIINTPALKVYVMKGYLDQSSSTELVSGYLATVKSVDGNALMFSVYLETGALFSNLPIEAIFCDRYSDIKLDEKLTTQMLQPYSCLDGDIDTVEISLLKHCPVKARFGERFKSGHYLFTIDYNGTDLADDPEQRKTHNIIVLEYGQLAALPNNHCLFLNESLTNNKEVEYPRHKRSTKYYTPGS